MIAPAADALINARETALLLASDMGDQK